MLIKDKGMRIELGEKARQTVENTFRWDTTVKKIKRILDSY